MLSVIFGIVVTSVLIGWAIEATAAACNVATEDNDSERTEALIAENERLLEECRRRRNR